jgi:hypothetical protein
MMSRWRTPLATIIAAFVVSAAAFADPSDDLRTRILKQTKVIVVTELPVPAAEYKGDGKANTLEIVILTKESDGPSRVTDDGEVIFLYKASKETQRELITRAFEIRIARAAGGS